MIAAILSISIITVNFWHVISEWLNNPPGNFFVGIAHYYKDYFLYVSQMAEGMNGRILSYAPMYTNERLPETFVYWPNVLMGHIGGMFTSNPFVVYLAFLLLLCSILCVLLWMLAKQMFPHNPTLQTTAFLFLTTASNAPNIATYLQSGSLSLLGDTWFSPTPALNRLGGVPHQTLQTILLLICIMLYTKKRSLVSTLFLIGVSFIAATVAPTQMLLCVATAGILFLFSPSPIQFFSLAVPAFVGAVITNRAFDQSVLFSVAKMWEATQVVPRSPVDFLLGVGPVALLLPFGIRPFLQSKQSIRTFLTLYFALSIGTFFSPIPALLHTSPTRWIHPASYVAISGIGVAGLFAITRRYRPLFFLFLLCYGLLTIPALMAQVVARQNMPFELNHIPKQTMTILSSIRTMPDGVVLTDPTLPYDIIIPILSHKPSFTGHPVHTLYPDTKEQLRNAYFSGAMSPKERQEFLTNHRISTIVTQQDAIIIVTPIL